jgi:integrase
MVYHNSAAYLWIKGVKKDKTFKRGAERNIQSAIDVLGDRPLDEYSSSDAAMYRDYLLKKGLNTASVRRNFSTIRSIINLTIQEHGLDCRNAFSKVYLPELDDVKQRRPIPIENIRQIQKDCVSYDDEVPHIDLKPHPWRRLKTKGSQRQIPLVGASLWAARRIKTNTNNSPYAFPRYTSGKGTNANSASAALNKWLKSRVPEGCVIHSFRHSLRDRLRAVQCPSDMIDQIGGWSTASVGQGYGKGYDLALMQGYLEGIS